MIEVGVVGGGGWRESERDRECSAARSEAVKHMKLINCTFK